METACPRIFLLSPAHCGGKRAATLFNERATFESAVRVRQPAGVPIGEVFSFLSELYFRGKLAYSTCFAIPPPRLTGAYAITSNRGLLPVQTPITLEELRAFGEVDIDLSDERYRAPLLRDARKLAADPFPRRIASCPKRPLIWSRAASNRRCFWD